MAVGSPAALINRTIRGDTEQARFAVRVKVVNDSFTRAASVAEGRADPAGPSQVFQRSLDGPSRHFHAPCERINFGPGETGVGAMVETVAERSIELARGPFERRVFNIAPMRAPHSAFRRGWFLRNAAHPTGGFFC